MIIKMNLMLGVALMLVNISLITAQDEEYTIFQLINAIKINDYTAVSELSKNINTNQPTRFNAAISQVLKHDFNKINLESLVQYFASHDNKEQRIYGYLAIFNELKSRNQLHRGVLVNLAFGLKNLLTKDLSAEVHEKANQLKSALPESVRNLAFASRVCIVNSKINAPLYADVAHKSAFDVAGSRRYTYASIPVAGGNVIRDSWIIEPYNGAYHIKNTALNEYLYAPGIFHVAKYGYRRIYTWIPGGYEGDDEAYQWSFESHGDLVLIKNQYYKEFLLINDDVKPDQTKQDVFSKPDYNESKLVLWKIEDCSQ